MTNKTARRRRPKPPADFDDNPAWTDADLARAVPARKAMPKLVEAMKRKPGRPAEGDKPKVPVSLRIDPDVLAAYKSVGEGWQKLIGDILAKAAPKLKAGGKRA